MINNMFKVKVENLKQLEIVLPSKKVSEIILSRDSFAECDLPKLVERIKKSDKLAWILMERISRYEENMKPVGANAKIVGANACGARIRRSELCEPASMDLRTSTDKIYEIKNLDGIIIQNIDSFAYMLRKINKAANQNLMVELNYTMNCYNNETKKVLETLYNEKRNNAKEVPLLFTAPVELNTYELSEVGYDTMIVYSYIDTMVSANCLRKNTSNEKHAVGAKQNVGANVKTVGADTICPSVADNLLSGICKYRFSFNNVQDFSSYIIDRKGKKLHYKTYCKYCYNKIFNTEPLYLLDKLDEIAGANAKTVRADMPEYLRRSAATQCDKIPLGDIRPCMGELCEPSYRIDFSFENEKEVKDILSMKCPESFTRGHYKTSIK